MNPADFLFTFLGTLTGGLITDMQTLLLGFVFIGFLMFGGQIIVGRFENAISNRQSVNAIGDTRAYYELRNASGKGTFEYEYYNSLYRSNMSKSLSLRQKSGGDIGDLYIGIPSSESSSSGSSSSSSFKGDYDTEFDALKSEGNSLEEIFPELADNSSPPSHFDNGPPPEYYGPPPEDEYYGPY